MAKFGRKNDFGIKQVLFGGFFFGRFFRIRLRYTGGSEVTIKAGIDSSVSQIRTPEARNIFYASLDGNLSAVNGALFREIYSRQLELYRKTPKERYIALITLYPQILDIVSLRDITSYLLITPVYLSRIRKNLPKKNPL